MRLADFQRLPGVPFVTDNGAPCQGCSGTCWQYKVASHRHGTTRFWAFCNSCYRDRKVEVLKWDGTAKAISSAHRALAVRI